MMVCYFIRCALLLVTFSSFSKYCQASSDAQTRLWHFEFEDLFVPDSCDEIANVGDHLLLEFEVLFQNGSTAAAIKRPQNLKHVVLDSSDDLPVVRGLKGMCAMASRRFIWSSSTDIDTNPVVSPRALNLPSHESVSMIVTVIHITPQEDYIIFDALKTRGNGDVIDIIDSHKGVNAVDEWGQTPLMIAVINKRLEIVATLLNTRLPSVDVNIAKPSGYTALFYAVEHAPISIVQALLRRGADPNQASKQPDSMGNTPLHCACWLEKSKYAELLLQYGANPFVQNAAGISPLQLVPRDAVMSTKLYFRRMFEEAASKWNSLTGPGTNTAERHDIPFRQDL